METTKKPTSAKANKENALILMIGTHKVALKSNLTTLKNVNTVVKSFFINFGLDKKETDILLPNGTKMKFNDLSNIKNFAKVLFPSQYLDASESEETKQFLDAIGKIQGVLYALPIDWDLVGVKDGKKILAMYQNANRKAIELEKVSPETKLIA